MDKETLNEVSEIIVDLKLNSKILRGLVDIILDNTKVDYTGDTLAIADSAPILAVIKAFYGDEYNNCLKEKISEREAEIAKLKALKEAEAKGKEEA